MTFSCNAAGSAPGPRQATFSPMCTFEEYSEPDVCDVLYIFTRKYDLIMRRTRHPIFRTEITAEYHS
jgi:hypothetical protein